MKKSPLTTILLVLLVISALASVALCYSYISSAREIRKLQTEAAMIQNNRTLINALAADVVAYSKKNPAIDPILKTAGLNPARSAPAAPSARTTAK